MAILITGVAGFVGCNLAVEFIRSGNTVFGVDNLCRGRQENLVSLETHVRFGFAKVDMSDLASYRSALSALQTREQITEIWHLAANSDIPAGIDDPYIDLRDTFMTTFNTLVLMKEFGIDVISFASSSAIYGDLGDRLLTEDIGPLLPISNYGAMKLASEAAISAAAECFLKRAYIFRFPNVIGAPATHGVVLDFVRKLKGTPVKLIVLGDGTQQKSYLHVEELIEAMFFIHERVQERVAIYNIGAGDEGVTVRFIAEETVRVASPGATIEYGNGNKGWVGDVPRFNYSIDKLRALGFKPRMGSAEAIKKAINQIVAQELSQ